MYYSREYHDTDTKCPKCNVEMEIGKAIRYGENGREQNVCTGFGRILLNHGTLVLIDCLKCPDCGYSNDLK